MEKLRQKTRVLHVAGNMNIGGAETFVMNVYRKIINDNIQFDFVIHGKEGKYIPEIRKLGGNIYHISDRKKNIFLNLYQYYKLFKNHKEYNTIHIHTNSSIVFPTLIIAWLCRIKVRICHSHSTSTKRKKLHIIFRPMLRLFANQYFACSNSAGEWLYGKKTITKGKVRIINNGIDSGRFQYDPLIRKDLRKELGITEKFVVGHIGNFRTPKNHSFLIDIFNKLQQRNEKAILVLVGGGELIDDIKEKVRCLGLQDKVLFLGVRKDVNVMLQIFDVLVFPSIFEGLPVTLIEAQATGLKCLVSDRITEEVKITDLVEFLSIEEDPEEWARIIESYSFYTRKTRDREIITNKYDISNTVKILLDIYK